MLISEIDGPNIIERGMIEKKIKKYLSKYIFFIFFYLNFLQTILLDL